MTTKHITAGWSGGPYLRLKPATVISLNVWGGFTGAT